jgi:predicted dehydrogenase
MRFLAGIDFDRIASRISSVRFRDLVLPYACSLLVELANGATAEVCVMTTKGQNERDAFVVGEEGSLFVTHESVVRQLRDDKEPVAVVIPDRDQLPQGAQLLQHTMNRIAEDFCDAVRTSGVEERSHTNLPSFEDGLHCQKVIAAAEKSDVKKRWVQNEELA